MKQAAALLAGLWGARAAAAPLLIAPEGSIHPRDEVPLELGVGAGPPPTLSVEEGVLLGPPLDLGDGRWRYRFRAPDRAGPVVARLDWGSAPTTELTIPIEPWATAEPVLPARVDHGLGTGDPVLINAPGVTGLVGPEGRSEAVEGGVMWTPGPEPFPRSVPLLAERFAANALPAATVVHLRARPRLPVQTEPGTRVSVEIGRRTYGPVTADAEGMARPSVEVRPGEVTATLVLEDAAGNVQRSSLSLGGGSRPALAVLAERRSPLQERAPRVHLFAVGADGSPWTGPPPSCVTSLGQEAVLAPAGSGRWAGSLVQAPGDHSFPLRVDCSLGDAAVATARVPPAPVQPTSIDLRLRPAEVEAELPRAVVRATLLGPEGDPVSASGLVVDAELGSIVEREPTPAGLQGVYVGDAAVAAGRDTLVARWSPAQGSGPVAALELGAARPPDAGHARLHARVLDAEGRPLRGRRVQLRSGQTSVAVDTDGQGWATAALEAGDAEAFVVLEATVEGITRRLLLPRGAEVGRSSGAVDVQATLPVPIRTGQVRRVFLGTDPGTLVSTGVERARVLVRLEDRDGHPVADPSMVLSASAGVVTRARRRADGTYEAWWAPPPGMQYGRVRITVRSGDDTFAATSTDLDVVPRQARRAPGLSAGWLQGPRGVSSPFIRVSGDLRLPVGDGLVFGRAWAAVYGQTAAARDLTGLDLSVDLDLVPLGSGLVVRQERGRLAGWIGGSLVLAPYRLETRVDGAIAARGLGWSRPGFELATGGGWRLRGGELTLDVGYIFLSVDTDGAGWRGPIGGGVATAGYRLLF